MQHQTFLLKGWTPTEKSLVQLSDGSKVVLFDRNKMLDPRRRNVTETNDEKWERSHVIGNSIRNVTENIAANCSIDASHAGMFTASVAAAYRQGSHFRTENSMIQVKRLGIVFTSVVNYPGLASAGAAREFLLAPILAAFDHAETEEQIVALYNELGFLFPWKADFGVQMNMQTVFESLSAEKTAAFANKIRADYDNLVTQVKGSGAANVDASLYSASTSVVVDVSNYGGSIQTLFEGNETAWIKSAYHNPAPVQAAFHPMYLLAPPPKRQLFEQVWRKLTQAPSFDQQVVPITVSPRKVDGYIFVKNESGRSFHIRVSSYTAGGDDAWQPLADGASKGWCRPEASGYEGVFIATKLGEGAYDIHECCYVNNGSYVTINASQLVASVPRQVNVTQQGKPNEIQIRNRSARPWRAFVSNFTGGKSDWFDIKSTNGTETWSRAGREMVVIVPLSDMHDRQKRVGFLVNPGAIVTIM